MEWRPKDWEKIKREIVFGLNYDNPSSEWLNEYTEKIADAIMLALWNMAKAQPDGILRLNSNEVGEGLRFEV